ncbi:MAG: class I tRNA ligase family protein, partial [Bacteroidales bacterium]|nr:class I tRNA ligase family protein [Bacteroidales bacterium]
GLEGVSSQDIADGKRLIFVSKNIPERARFTDPVHADIHIVENDVLDMDAFRAWMPHWKEAEFITEDGRYICGSEIEKMSKSMYNVQNPDEIVERYGADTLRMYEMFLGPIEQSKPWDTQGIEGVYRFLKKFWRLVFPENGAPVDEQPATPEELKALHLAIRHIGEDTDRFSFNTAVSRFMITVNQLTDLKCRKRSILEPFTVLLAPYAPHICEEIWQALGHTDSISYAAYPVFEEKYTVETSLNYPVSFNGKTRFSLSFPAEATPADIEKAVLADPQTAKWTEGKTVKKVIVVPKRIVNIVVA